MEWAGGDGRPLEQEAVEDLFRILFPDGDEAMRRAARGRCAPDDPAVRRWEALLELARRALSAPRRRDAPLRSASEVFERCRFRVGDLPVETFLVLLLDAKHRPVRGVRVSTGILNGSLVHPREIFAPAVAARAAAVILVHNHPSGDPSPSREDRAITARIRNAGEILGIPVLDHVIIGSCTFFSFREEADWR
ncbi:MAG: hypothetical protein Kow00128_04210 [Deltaproteobacteria bacterium]